MAERSDREREKNKIQSQTKHIPKDAQIIIAIMKDMGITEYEPRVINQLLEFTYRYVTCVLDDAKIYANHAKKKFIHLEDVKLAVQLTLERTFTSPLPREIYVEMARSKNHAPLPLIKPHCGLRLPADRYCLSSCNYKLRPHLPVKKNTKNTEGRHNIKFPTKGNNTTIKRQQSSTLSNVSKTQNVTIPKPVFKFSTGASQKVPAKPKIQVNSAPPSAPTATAPTIVKMEVDEMPTVKRKREEDEFEIVG